ncbi:phosphatase PAP2 family protein [Mangrovibacterium sp.]|uniref:phosphatase PAP2 family protein n=1 Tax=Mangrovibacterium sp. TaxID=1961364 RepID=UPI003561915B
MKILNQEAKVFRNDGLRYYLLAYTIFILLGLVVLLTTNYGDVVLFINKYSRMEWDRAVDWITRIGLGSTMAIVAVGFALYKLRYSLMMLFNLALVGLVTALFKKLLFPDIVRPLKYFDPEAFHRMVQLTDYNLLHSFPSGHTMTIFAMMSLLAYFSGRNFVAVICVVVAIVVGFSRIYLCQHFFVDVYVGSMLGLICTGTTIWVGDYAIKLRSKHLFENPFLIRQAKRSFTAFFW